MVERPPRQDAVQRLADPAGREQVPGIFSRFDDPFGVTWRLVNKLRRLSVRRSSRFLAGYVGHVRFERPVFIIGVPRSGTTMLFELLRESEQLGALPHEGHDLWRAFHHPRWTRWDSDVVGAGEVRRGERRFVNSYLHSYFTSRRFVEKTPENCLRIPYLLELFPDAYFVALHRNPMDVISSLISGWLHPQGRFRSYFVPEDLTMSGYDRRRQWCFALIEGWRSLAASDIPDVATAQWEHCVEHLAAGRRLVPASRWTEIHLESLLDEPETTMANVYQSIGIQDSRPLRLKLAEVIDRPVNALSAPGPAKWRRDNYEDVRRLLPRISSSSSLIGYRVDPISGEFQLMPPSATPGN